MKKVAIIFIGTGRYLEFLPKYYEQAEANLFPDRPKHYYVFTDGDLGNELADNVTVYEQEHLQWPYITLYRFGIIQKHLEDIEKECGFLLFMDADTQVVSPVSFEEVFKKGKPYTGVHHPCHALNMPPHNEFPGSLETNTASKAACKPGDDFSVYWQGCVWGGNIKGARKIIDTLHHRTKQDEENGIIAKWHDESHINRYFLDNKDKVNTLSPSFAYPESFTEYMEDYEPKIVHLAKENSKYQV